MLPAIILGTIMIELQSLIRLQTWLSPAFPIGAFSYSHGLEAAINTGTISEKTELRQWLKDLLSSGPGWNEAVLLSESWRIASHGTSQLQIAELAIAMNFSSERHLESTAQGHAFLLASKAWCETDLPHDCPLSVAVGAVAGKLKIDLKETLAAYLHAYISNQIQAAIRLMKLGQQEGVELLAGFESPIVQTVQRAAASNLDDLGSACFIADVMAMHHETLEARIFRS